MIGWEDFEPSNDRDEMAYALMVAGIVVYDRDGDNVLLDFDTADRVLEALSTRGPRDPTARMLVAWRDIAEPLPENDRLDVLARFLRVILDHGRAWVWPVR